MVVNFHSIKCFLAMLVAPLAFTQMTQANILPENDLYLEDNLFSRDANITEEEFADIVNDIVAQYEPIASKHGKKLVAKLNWKDSTVNASANRFSNSWYINMYGGLARRPEVTKDGFALVVCHELGHHFAGYPFSGWLFKWASNEGQSDYFATHACAQKIWANDIAVNATFRQTVDATAKEKCDAAWADTDAQNLCYRSAMAGKSLADLLNALRSSKTEVSFATPSTNTTSKTQHAHPAAQCRLDTYFSGALCDVDFEENLIPGLETWKIWGSNNETSEIESYKVSCARRDGYEASARPRCWYAPRVLN